MSIKNEINHAGRALVERRVGRENWRREMIVTLTGMPDGKDFEYETGFHYFIDHVRVRIAEHMPPNTTPSYGAKPINVMPMEREITFYFSHNIGGRDIYTAVPNGTELTGAL